MENYTLIITEKPDAAKRIAQALDAKHAPTENRGRGTPYYTVKRDKNIIVVPALGHLYTVAQEKTGRGHYPVFSYKWIPRHLADKKSRHVKIVLETISKLAEKADTFIDACDYDIEGSLIGYNILKHACNKREDRAKRMKYSTLTQDELEKAYQRLQPHLDFALIESGMTRHEVDWLYGINLTRALTTAAKNATGRYAMLSTGRVQGPTLKFIAEREEQIRTHVPTPYWQLQAKLRIGKQTFLAQYEKARIETQEEAQQILSECKGNDGQITQVKTRILRQAPPVPFDLGTLQGEAYRLFGYMPHRTLQIAQQLYVSAIISYPRTSSQKLPSSIDYPAILRNLGRVPAYRNLIREILIRPDITPHQGSREDSAHPAIYPTGYLPKTATGQENRIFDLIVRRFLAVFGEPALKEKTLVTLGINKHRFHLAGGRTLRSGWMHYYSPYCITVGSPLPSLRESDKISVDQLNLEDTFTTPKTRYNPSTLLKQMEKSEIGTKATRAEVIQTLYNRLYIQNESITATDLGLAVTTALEEYCPRIISTTLTRQIEKGITEIQKGNSKEQEIIDETIATLKPILKKIKESEKNIGMSVGEALDKLRFEQKTIGKCLSCKTGRLVIIRSRKTKKRFIGCTNYFKNQCRTTFPLPQKGAVRPTNRPCRTCGWPIVTVRAFRKRPWNLCINPDCPSKKEEDRQ